MGILEFVMYYCLSSMFLWSMCYVLYPELAVEDETGCDALLWGTDHLFY